MKATGGGDRLEATDGGDRWRRPMAAIAGGDGGVGGAESPVVPRPEARRAVAAIALATPAQTGGEAHRGRLRRRVRRMHPRTCRTSWRFRTPVLAGACTSAPRARRRVRRVPPTLTLECGAGGAESPVVPRPEAGRAVAAIALATSAPTGGRAPPPQRETHDCGLRRGAAPCSSGSRALRLPPLRSRRLPPPCFFFTSYFQQGESGHTRLPCTPWFRA